MKFTFASGDQPLDGYTIKRTIHRGGFGEVYYAETDAGKQVALKLLHENCDIELRGVSQCLNLKHRNLVTIFDIKHDADGDHWVVMEYISGETLADVIRRHPHGMPEELVQKLLPQILDGLTFLHDRSLVHRDLKPANIFVEGDTIKIGDVGLSKFIGPSKRSAQTQSVGTVHYMAPEIAKGDYGRGVDIYAVGVILFEMLTGRVPFDGESTGEILMKHLTQPPDVSGVDEKYRNVLKTALAKEERQRFATADELNNSFQTAAASNKKWTHAAAAPEPMDWGPNATANPQAAGSAGKRQPQWAACSPKGEKPIGKCCGPPDGSWLWLAAMVGILIFAVRGLHRMPTWISVILFGTSLAAAWYCHRRFKAGDSPRSVVPPPVPSAAYRPAKQKASTPVKFVRSPRARLAGGLQSIAAAPIVIGLIVAAILFFSRDFFSSVWIQNGIDPAHVGFFLVSTTVATWAILILTQLFPRKRREPSGRRFAWLGTGILAGAAAFGCSNWFLVQFPPYLFGEHSAGLVSSIGRHQLATTKPTGVTWPDATWHSWDGLEMEDQQVLPAMAQADVEPVFYQPYEESVASTAFASDESMSQVAQLLPTETYAPTLFGYAVFFGVLFSMRNWDKLTSYRRPYRFQWGSVALTAMLAYVICCVFTFPTVWGMTWAAAITAVVQLSAPCESR